MIKIKNKREYLISFVMSAGLILFFFSMFIAGLSLTKQGLIGSLQKMPYLMIIGIILFFIVAFIYVFKKLLGAEQTYVSYCRDLNSDDDSDTPKWLFDEKNDYNIKTPNIISDPNHLYFSGNIYNIDNN